MYYYQDMTTGSIAREMHVSRSTVSRLLSFAKQKGLVEIKIKNPYEHPQHL
jgi:deoxyribonucleoside regulator